MPSERTTVYPSRAGGFPPASFARYRDAIAYCLQVREAATLAHCGICECPAASFLPIHYKDTVR